MADSSSPVTIAAGTILYYRMVDIAEQLDLEAAERQLGSRRHTTRLSLGRDADAFVLQAAPLRVRLGEVEVALPGRSVLMRLMLKVWDYGVLSFEFTQRIEPGTALDRVHELAAAAVRGFELEEIARKQAAELAS